MIRADSSDEHLDSEINFNEDQMRAFLSTASLHSVGVALLRVGVHGAAENPLRLLASRLDGEQVIDASGNGVIEILAFSYADAYAQTGKSFPDPGIEAAGTLELLSLLLSLGFTPNGTKALDFLRYSRLDSAAALLL